MRSRGTSRRRRAARLRPRGFVWRSHSSRDLNTAPRRPLARGTAARLQMSCGGRLRRRHVRERHCTARDVGSWVQQPSARARTSLRSDAQIRRAAGSPSEQAAAKAPKGFKTRAATPGGARHRSAARGRLSSHAPPDAAAGRFSADPRLVGAPRPKSNWIYLIVLV